MRPITTLFLLQSLDGKINSGDSDSLDVDRDWITIPRLKEGIDQYYAIEQETDLFSLNTGRVMQKIGVNSKPLPKIQLPCTFVIIDNKPHLSKRGVIYLSNFTKEVLIVTTNRRHLANELIDTGECKNVKVLNYNKLDLPALLDQLYTEYGCKRLTIQSGGQLNGLFLREDLIDYVNIVIAPVLVGGSTTPTLIDGDAIHTVGDINKIRTMRLMECNVLNNSYIQVIYKVNH